MCQVSPGSLLSHLPKPPKTSLRWNDYSKFPLGVNECFHNLIEWHPSRVPKIKALIHIFSMWHQSVSSLISVFFTFLHSLPSPIWFAQCTVVFILLGTLALKLQCIKKLLLKSYNVFWDIWSFIYEHSFILILQPWYRIMSFHHTDEKLDHELHHTLISRNSWIKKKKLICLLFSLQDLLYEYNFSVGNSPTKLLYKGRDYQHYFYLPSGDPYDDYKGSFKELQKCLNNSCSQKLSCSFVTELLCYIMTFLDLMMFMVNISWFMINFKCWSALAVSKSMFLYFTC